MTTPELVARWMFKELERDRYLYRDAVAFDITRKFGPEFTYVMANGKMAIDKRILKEFRKVTTGKVLWDRGDRLWRFREEYEDPNKGKVA